MTPGRLVGVMAAVVWASCVSPPLSDAGVDAGGNHDAGVLDGGVTVDAGLDAGAPDAGPVVSFDDYCASIDRIRCEFLSRCGYYESVDECVRLVTVPFCHWYRAGVLHGRVRFDGAAAMACLEQAQTSCAVSPFSCPGVFSGLLQANDGGCYSSTDCAGSLYCDALPSTCPGRCRRGADAGDVVSFPGACLDGLAGVLTVLDGGSLGWVCRPLGLLGASCGSDAPCDYKLVCNTETSHCEALRDAGDNCEAVDGGALDELCPWLLACQRDGTGHSACLPRGRRGEPCGVCLQDLRCVPADGGSWCQPRLDAGAACDGFEDCALGLYCLTVGGGLGAGTCQPPLADGALCASGVFATCASRVCAAVPVTDGGLDELRCGPSDGGRGYSICEDTTP